MYPNRAANAVDSRLQSDDSRVVERTGKFGLDTCPWHHGSARGRWNQVIQRLGSADRLGRRVVWTVGRVARFVGIGVSDAGPPASGTAVQLAAVPRCEGCVGKG